MAKGKIGGIGSAIRKISTPKIDKMKARLEKLEERFDALDARCCDRSNAASDAYSLFDDIEYGKFNKVTPKKLLKAFFAIKADHSKLARKENRLADKLDSDIMDLSNDIYDAQKKVYEKKHGKLIGLTGKKTKFKGTKKAKGGGRW